MSPPHVRKIPSIAVAACPEIFTRVDFSAIATLTAPPRKEACHPTRDSPPASP
eukprot:CAMPEP_0171872322 /NCGR_PEP_ID=MMETSP0992-20121227/33731_1 /TAXON_ID=483369 /ORGANISM="non described non described, Strain CCMP2098" /LENGTH=52 /DNA_ID=CAMNT_0012496757 /DNA_START=48 /DNA_END=203 /DNA_ORIENTATION=-